MKHILGVLALVLWLLAGGSAPVLAQGYSNYGRVDASNSMVGDPIDLALGDKNVTEVDYASAYPGLELRRTLVRARGRSTWLFEFEQTLLEPFIVAGGRTSFNYDIQLLDRRFGWRIGNDLGGISEVETLPPGIFERVHDLGNDKAVLIDPASDTQLFFSSTNVNGFLDSKVSRDGTTVYFEGRGGPCSSVNMRHGPSGAVIAVQYQLVVGTSVCKPTVVTLPDGGTINYTWTQSSRNVSQNGPLPSMKHRVMKANMKRPFQKTFLLQTGLRWRR